MSTIDIWLCCITDYLKEPTAQFAYKLLRANYSGEYNAQSDDMEGCTCLHPMISKIFFK